VYRVPAILGLLQMALVCGAEAMMRLKLEGEEFDTIS